MEDFTWDCETTGLLNEESIDYTASPFTLKDSFKMHCVVVEEHEDGKIIAFYDGPTYIFDGREYVEEFDGVKYELKNYAPLIYEHRPLKSFPAYVKSKRNRFKVIAHNQINFDLLTAKLWFGMDYTVEEDTWCGQSVEFKDTLVISKVLNPDRFGGHSLDALSEKAGLRKLSFRKHIPEKERFKHFAADMLYYCIYDNKSNTQVYKMLMKEWGVWKWEDAYALEKAVADIITRQEHRGFYFNKEQAEHNIKELDALMEERRLRAEPCLPPKLATKGVQKEFTPPAKQFLKNGEPNSFIKKFAEKHGTTVEGNAEDGYFLIWKGEKLKLPIPQDPLITTVPATLNDTTHIKNWLVGLGWRPSEYKEKDLSTKTGTKIKRTQEELKEAIDKYVEQTMACNFKEDRCEHLGIKIDSKLRADVLRTKLRSYKEGRAIKVLTNPSFTKGQEKELCPDLLRISEQFPYAKDVVEYLTYKHRRNSILGGGAEWDEDEEEYEKGYLAAVRSDGRIPTPAATCDAATSRMKHRLVANIPRVTSLYGWEMRSLFGVDDGFYQIGYDFDSLEAREEAHYCFRYEAEPKEYCASLLLDKPNDVHTKMAQRISEIIKRQFERSPAKSVKYGCTYGAQGPKVAKTIGCDLETGDLIFNAFWEAAFPLKGLKEALHKYWEKTGKKYILGLDGRQVPTRSAHAILNSLFQSAGVICAKRAMVIHDRLLRAEGLSVDFFRDDWKTKKFFQQLIAYHDEAQGEVSKSLVKFKMFGTKEEAQEFKDEMLRIQRQIWSDIKQAPKGGVFVAYSRPGELAAIAVKKAGEYYNLNVELTAGYMLGRNWAECH